VVFSARYDPRGVMTPADIAHGFIETPSKVEEIVLNVGSTHKKGSFCDKDRRIVERELKEIKHTKQGTERKERVNKKDYGS
jgi:hypothetical protein